MGSDRFRFDNGLNFGGENGNVVTNGHDYRIVANGNSLATLVEDETDGVSWDGGALDESELDLDNQLVLLSSYQNGENRNLDHYAWCRIYSFKVTDSAGASRCELVPARRASDGALGLYDTIRDTFLVNAGTGKFSAPPATKVWNDGASGKVSSQGSWADNAVWPDGANGAYFGNTKGGAANVWNDYAMSESDRMADFFVQDGAFYIYADNTIYHDNFYLINGTSSEFAPGTSASVVKRGDWTSTGGEFIIGWKSGVTVAFTNETGSCAGIGGSFAGTRNLAFQVAGWGSTTTTAPEAPYSGMDAEFTMNGGSVTVVGGVNAGIACANDSNARLVVNGGTMSVGATTYIGIGEGSNGELSLNGGTFETRKIEYGGGGSASLAFNGGTLKAKADTKTFIEEDPRLVVQTGVRGGTIDTAGCDITVPASISGDGGMTIAGGGTVALTGENTYAGATVIEAGTLLKMPAADNLAGDIFVANVSSDVCPLTVLTLTGGDDVDDALLARCSLAEDAPDSVELTKDGASVVAVAVTQVPADARLVFDSGASEWTWRFYDANGSLMTGTVDEGEIGGSSVTVYFGSTDEAAALAALDPVPGWIKGYKMASPFYVVSGSASETFTETYLTLGGNLELRKTGEGTYAMTKDQPHTGGTVVAAGTLTRDSTVTIGSGAARSLTVENGDFTISNSAHMYVGNNGDGVFIVSNGTASVGNFYIGSSGTGAGTVDIEGGTVTVSGWSYLANNGSSGGALLKLGGGTLMTQRINCGSNTDSTILFDGGTL